MSNRIRITVLVENTVRRAGLSAEHGLSFLIDTAGGNVMLDTGQSDLATRNAAVLGADLSGVKSVVLSHGHYDHTGGLPAILKSSPDARIWMHPAALQPKYSRSPQGAIRHIGMGSEALAAVQHQAGRFETRSTWTQIAPEIWMTGQIPRANHHEDTGGAFYLDEAGLNPDPLLDDQALVIDLGRSQVLLLGCAHSGVANTLDYVREKTGDKPVSAIIGGFHLGSASAERMDKTLERLRAASPERLAPLHCTGWPATALMWNAFPAAFESCATGSVFEFETQRSNP